MIWTHFSPIVSSSPCDASLPFCSFPTESWPTCIAGSAVITLPAVSCPSSVCPMEGIGCPMACPAGGCTFIPMEGSGPLREPPIGVTLPGRGPICGRSGIMLPVILCPRDPGGGDIGLFSAIGERGDLKGCAVKMGEKLLLSYIVQARHHFRDFFCMEIQLYFIL